MGGMVILAPDKFTPFELSKFILNLIFIGVLVGVSFLLYYLNLKPRPDGETSDSQGITWLVNGVSIVMSSFIGILIILTYVYDYFTRYKPQSGGRRRR